MRVMRVVAPMRQQAAEAIRHAIATGELRPGDRLVDRDLSDRIGVSRATLREAYSQLESEGFITVTPHRGATVARMSAADAVAVYEVREALECHAIRLFAERATDAELASLGDAVGELRTAHECGDVDAMLAAKQAFYAKLYAGARNELLEGQASLLQSRLWRLRAQSLGRPGRAQASQTELEEVLAALRDRGGDRASQLWRSHIRAAAEAALADDAATPSTSDVESA